MQLIVITPEQDCTDEISMINYIVSKAGTRLHIRKPLYLETAYRKYIMGIEEEFHSKLSIDNYAGLMDEFPTIGFHAKSSVRNDVAFMKKVKSLQPSILSTSFHSWSELGDNQMPYNYVFISPVFDSISKKGYKAAINITKAAAFKSKLAKQNKPVPAIIALGGINASRINLLHSMGFDGVAVLGAVWQSIDPLQTFEEIRKVITELPTD